MITKSDVNRLLDFGFRNIDDRESRDKLRLSWVCGGYIFNFDLSLFWERDEDGEYTLFHSYSAFLEQHKIDHDFIIDGFITAFNGREIVCDVIESVDEMMALCKMFGYKKGDER